MGEKFKGLVEIQNAANALTIGLDGDHADIAAGGNGQDGDLIIKDSIGKQTIHIYGKTGDMLLGAAVPGEVSIHLDASHAALHLGRFGNEGHVIVRDGAAKERIILDGGEGDIFVWDKNKKELFHFDSHYAALYIGGEGNEGDVIVRDGAGKQRIGLDGGDGDIAVWDKNKKELFRFDSHRAALYIGGEGNEGDIIVRDGDGNTRIHLDGNSGDIRLTGADCAEEFDVVETEEVHPGTVLVIDNEIKLRPCNEAYDKRVAGIVSGGNGSNPGIILDKNPSQNARLPVALNGKVYCKVDAQYSPIEVGDLLTTSPTPGHAMKAEEPLKAFGAVIGKALRPLHEGTGMIPVLVALQ